MTSRTFPLHTSVCLVLLVGSLAWAADRPPVQLDKQPVLQSIQDAQYKLGGELGRRLAAFTENWIIPAPQANPYMLDMFQDSLREHKPFASPMGWAGEYAGKYLTHAVQTYKLTHDEKLRKHIADFVAKLVALQAQDGYMGPWPKEARWKPGPWDTWGHYHVMLGLIFWYEQSQDAKALACAEKIADMLCKTFLHVDETKAGIMECEAPIHALCLLYEMTGRKQYLELAQEIEQKFEQRGDYVRMALAGREFFESPRPRWEGLPTVQAIAELYFITGDEKYRKAYEHIWWSLVKTDRHNNGGFSTGEQAMGNPYQYGPIETCCTVAWMAVSVDMLRMTGDSRVADELEFSMLNSGLGLMSPSGKWVTYDTPPDGVRIPTMESLGWQGGPKSPQLSCCGVNGPRAIAMTCEWAMMRDGYGLVVNYYGPGSMASPTASGNPVSIVQETDYPAGDTIHIVVNPARAEEFTLSLRIPYWSDKTSVSVNGQGVKAVPGQYLKLKRKWAAGDRVVVKFDFRPHFWAYRPATKATHWDTTWTLFGPLEDLTEPQLAELEKQVAAATEDIPKTMAYSATDGKKTLTPKTAAAKHGYIDLVREVDGRNQEQFAYAFARYDSPVDEKARMTFSVSGQVTLYVNGKKTEIGGSGENPRYGRGLSAEIPLHKGRNVIAFRIPWVGGVGWFLSAGWVRPCAPGVMEASIYRGPILLTFDPRFNKFDQASVPVLKSTAVPTLVTNFNESPKPMVLCDITGADGKTVRLCDFAMAGATGLPYQSWLAVHFGKPTSNAFSKDNPLRSFRP